MGRVGEGADPLEWQLVSGRLGSPAGLYEGTPLETALRNRTVAILGPVLRRIGMTAQPGESPLVTNLRESLVYRLGAAGDGQVLAQARSYVAQLKTNPTAIPPAIRAPVLSTFATYATPADWDALLALTQAETNPVAKNRYVSLLGAAEDDAVATRALALLKTDTFTAPRRRRCCGRFRAAIPIWHSIGRWRTTRWSMASSRKAAVRASSSVWAEARPTPRCRARSKASRRRSRKPRVRRRVV